MVGTEIAIAAHQRARIPIYRRIVIELAQMVCMGNSFHPPFEKVYHAPAVVSDKPYVWKINKDPRINKAHHS
jgi:hypothetical protein